MKNTSEASSSMLIHLSALAAYVVPFGSIILPLILWQTTKKDSDYIDHHGKEAVNFNLSFLLYNIISIVLLFGSVFGTIFSAIQAGDSASGADIAGMLLGTGSFVAAITVLSIIGIVKIILMIIAAVKANQGAWYRYPLIIRFIK